MAPLSLARAGDEHKGGDCHGRASPHKGAMRVCHSIHLSNNAQPSTTKMRLESAQARSPTQGRIQSGAINNYLPRYALAEPNPRAAGNGTPPRSDWPGLARVTKAGAQS